MNKKMKIITLCGSTKFKSIFEKVNADLTLSGNIVLSVGVFGKCRNDIGKDENILLDDKDKELLDKIHLAKIDMSDEIFVINVDGYIGESTKKEIKYAKIKGKNIRYLNPIVIGHKLYQINGKNSKLLEERIDTAEKNKK